jgi:cytoskeletal protein CcmA (bactofilin family)
LVCGGWAVDAGATDPQSAQARWGDAVFVAGGTVRVSDPVSGNLLAAGGSVDIDAPVARDLVAGGGRLRVGAPVGGSVHAAAGQLTLQGPIGGDVRIAGGQVEVAPAADVAGDLSLAGGHLRLLGAVHGNVHAAGGRLLIDGTVDGEVVASAGVVELGPRARVAGRLLQRGGTLERDPQARVGGGVESWWGERADTPSAPVPHDGARRALGWAWTIALVLLAAVLLAALPRFHERVGRTLQRQPGQSLLLGVACLIGVPVALAAIGLTVLGIPLALLGALLYVLLLPFAYVSTAIAVGDAVLQAWRSATPTAWVWRTVAAALVIVLLSQAMRVPWLGTTLAALALLAGLGALALQLRRQPQPA